MNKFYILFLTIVTVFTGALIANADVTVPSPIGGVSISGGNGGSTTPYTYNYSSGPLDLDTDNVLNNLTSTDGNTVLTNITTLSYGTGGGFDFSPKDKRPYLRIYATGHLQTRYIHTYSTNLLENTADAGPVTLVGDSVTVSDTIDTGVASKGDDGGHITITATGGDVQTRLIDTYASNAAGGNAGLVHITANGSVNIMSNIWAHGAKQSGATNQVVITAGTNIFVNGDILTESTAGKSGGITLDGYAGVTVTGKLSGAGKDGCNGGVNVSSSAGDVSVSGDITTIQSQGGSPRGAVTITAGNNVWVGGDILTYASRQNSTDGPVTITTGGDITLDGEIDTHGSQYQTAGIASEGGPVSMTAGGNITATERICTAIINAATVHTTNDAGNISITGTQDVVLGDLDTTTISTNNTSDGGDIRIVSTTGDIYLSGNMDARALAGTYGDLTISAPGGIITIGDITVTNFNLVTLDASIYGLIITGDIDGLTIAGNTVKGGFKTNSLSGDILYNESANVDLTGEYKILDKDTDADTGRKLVIKFPTSTAIIIK